jgi:hypothetical protein
MMWMKGPPNPAPDAGLVFAKFEQAMICALIPA